jgi:hypothetical protein
LSLPAMRLPATSPFGAAAEMLFVLAAVIGLLTAVWCIAAWASFRQAFGATRQQAVLATALWVALLVALCWLAGRVAG